MKHYFIWLKPSQELYTQSNEIIQNLCDDYGAENFTAHITIGGASHDLSQREVIEKVKTLTAEFSPIEFSLGEVIIGTNYHNAITRPVNMPNLDLQRIHARAHEIFNIKVPEFHPHLSLMYGNYPQNIKEDVLQKLQEYTFLDNGLATHIQIAYGDVEERADTWEIIHELEL